MTLKAIVAFLTICLLIFTAGCSTVHDVSYDYNTNIDLNRLKTYDWLRVPEKEGIKELDVVRIKDAVNEDLEAKGIMQAIDNPDFLIAVYLERKKKVSANRLGYGPHPGYYGYGPYRRYRDYSPHRGYRGYGPHRGYRKHAPHAGYRKYRPYPHYHAYGPYPGFHRYGLYPHYRGYGSVSVIQYEEGTLTLDFVDPELNEVIWTGAAKSFVHDSMVTQKREKLIHDAVQKILVNFPPAS